MDNATASPFTPRHSMNANIASLTRRLLTFTLAAASLLSTLTTRAAEAKKDDTFLDAKDAGADFQVQGEYAADKLGAQVIALGNGTFRAVFHQGGLPGAGWDGEAKVEIDGKTADGKTTFAAADGKGYSAEITDGTTLTGKTDAGVSFSLKKIVRESPTAGAKPPAGAVILFDGANADAWAGGHTDQRNLLASGSKTKQLFGDFTLHVEFLLPFKPFGRGQGRANSGVYMQDRYEVQVLDSFGLKGLNNECGGIYTKAAPRVNMCFPPLSWQTYDIDFTAARFDDAGKKTKNAIATVKHNGVLIHEQYEIPGPTGGGAPEKPTPGAIQLQGHGNPVFYRNVWIVEKK